jgi:hypothetical protein
MFAFEFSLKQYLFCFYFENKKIKRTAGFIGIKIPDVFAPKAN